MEDNLCNWCKLTKRGNITNMNEKTLRKLESNPHYKLSSKQKNQLACLEARKPVLEFGTPSYHDNEVPKHDVKVEKIKRHDKKQV